MVKDGALDPEKVARQIQALLGQEYINLVGTCKADYDGRSSSHIGWGQRILSIKQDNTFLLNAPHDVKPLNWQPGKNLDITLTLEDNNLIITSVRKKPKETLQVTFTEIMDFTHYPLEDGESIEWGKREKDMVVFLVQNPSFINPDFTLIQTEYPTEYGPIDLYGTIKGMPTVVEVKRSKTSGIEGVRQLIRYKKHFENYGKHVDCVLVCPDVNQYTMEMIQTNGFKHVSLDPHKDLESIEFKEEHVKQTKIISW